MLGDRYGFRSLCSEIPATEFKLFLDVAQEKSVDTSEFEKWYKLDENSHPLAYILQVKKR